MLSTENPSDPSCSSSKVSGSRADERGSDHLSLQEGANPAAVGLLEPQSSNFSIRDYVFSSRNKDCCSNWPFPRHLLELCVKHGICDLLPPFERSSSVRAKITCEKPAATTEKNSSYQLHGEPYSNQAELSSSSDDVVSNSLVSAEGPCLISNEDKNDKFVHDDCKLSSTVTTHYAIERNSAKFREPEAVDNLRTVEDIISASTIVSDVMASNVCPVCKTFSSTSNTTLNAHMDQCLAMESDANMLADKIPKLKVKPRKKRLMEDVYAMAPHCTLEDLDRRNGTSWAKDITTAMPIIEANPKLPQVTTRNDNKNEGAVYVDSNGIKLRILSKFDDAPRVISMEESRTAKNAKADKKNKVLVAKYSKKMKLKWKKKKLCFLNLFNDEIQATKEVSLHEEFDHDVVRRPVQLSGEQEQIGRYGFAALQRWPCSKRSNLPKKVRNLVKLSESVETMTTDFESNSVKITENQKKRSLPLKVTLSNAVPLKLSSESVALGSSARSATLNSGTKKLGKHRSLLGMGKRKRELLSKEMSVPEEVTNAVSSHCRVSEQNASEFEVENSIIASDFLEKADDGSSVASKSVNKKEKQTPAELICRGIESSVCLTSNGDPIPSRQRESSSIPLKPPTSDGFRIGPTEKKHKQLPDYQPCCCSMPTAKLKNFRGYSMKQTLSSLDSHPSSNSESVVIPVKESSSVSAKSSSNSILRLMGKNLMVIHSEDSAHHPNTQPPAPPSSLVQSQAPLTNNKGYKPKEIMVIDDTENDDIVSTATLPRASFPVIPYFPLHMQLLNKENAVNRGSSLALPASLWPRPLVFSPHSVTNFSSLFYYPQKLR
ncbi:hypothetical protein AXF42_Ash010666 [Apostasia shenzhenica]|uniref:UBZ4-type domain-containing protein n=1 Tax=Apostasia shenzhenica TaxID=1088818 RepID=A0A2I0A6R8_9ASPA|nr:hypothetical protein AXF42_Ash010666 [Apostasia shenzhenica]